VIDPVSTFYKTTTGEVARLRLSPVREIVPDEAMFGETALRDGLDDLLQ
jgi:hypothetical protein